MNRNRSLLTVGFILLWAAPLLAQTTTGTIVGMVTDKSGALIQRAKVTVRNQETNLLRTVETDQRGEYTVPLLSPGFYEVTV